MIIPAGNDHQGGNEKLARKKGHLLTAAGDLEERERDTMKKKKKTTKALF